MTISNLPKGNVTVVRIAGELNSVSGPQLKQRLNDLFAGGARHVAIDLSSVAFIDSMGLGALVAGLKNAKQHDGMLVLVGLREQARAIFELTMAYRIFDLFDTMNEAESFLEGR